MPGNEILAGINKSGGISREVFSVYLNLAITKTRDLDLVVTEISAVKESISGIIISDPPSSIGMDRLVAAALVKERTGIDMIFPMHCRDKNRLDLISALLGARAAGIDKILPVTGNHPSLLGSSHAKPTFDLDSTQLLNLAQSLLNLNENKSDGIPILLGAVVNPNLKNTAIDIEMFRLKRKMEFSPAFLISLPIIDLDASIALLDELEKLNLPVIYGLLPYSGEDHFLQVMHHRPADFPRSPYEVEFAALIELNKKNRQLAEKIDRLNHSWILSAMNTLSKRVECAGVSIDLRTYPRFISKLSGSIVKHKNVVE